MVNEFGSGKRTYGDLSFVTKDSTRTVKGLQFPVNTSNTGGMFARNFDAEAIKDGLIQLIMTQQGERPMNYTYGTILRNAVFAPLDGQLISEINSSIETAIRRFEPRVSIRTLQVTPNEENSGVDISLVFSIKDDVFSTQTINLTVNAQGAQING
jgi:phage baseplate assembly protein W